MKYAYLAAILLIAACGGDEPDTAPGDTEAVVETESPDIIDDDEIAGGPCAYEETIIDAHVVAIEDDRVELAMSGGEQFYIPTEDFPAPPRAGDDYTIRQELITEGTCTPEIYTVIEGDVGGVE